MKKVFAFTALIALCVMVQAASVLAQETRFVSPEGSDNNGEGTYASPWRTIQHAVDEARAGDVVMVYGGNSDFSYGETVTVDKDLTLSASGNGSNSITTEKIIIAEGARVVVTGFAEKTVIDGTLANGTKPAKRK